MATTQTSHSAHSTPPKSPTILKVWSSAFTAMKTLPAVRKSVLSMALVGSALFIVLTALTLFLFDALLIDRYLGLLKEDHGTFANVMAMLGRIMLYLLVGVVSVIVNLRIVILLTSFWNEILVSRIVNHFRPLASPPFSWSRFRSDALRSIVLLLRDIAIMVALLLIGLISVVGFPLVLIAEVLLAGASIRAAYVDVLRSAGQDHVPVRRALRAAVPQLGLVPTLLSLVPFVGWLLIPGCVVLQLIGFTWAVESSAAAQD